MRPDATGSQNNVRYAYFAGSRRLAVEADGHIRVYDTRDHRIGGFSQQQGVGGSILFTSQLGTVSLATLPVVSVDGRPAAPPKDARRTPPSPTESAGPGLVSEPDVLSAIERLGDLHAKGILSDEEFKKRPRC
ncbi:MAG: SHOCT domain-containing protein [Gammaproteobacteria bacterium]